MNAEWLFEKEKYDPRTDKDAFIDRTILSFLKILTKIRIQGKAGETINVEPVLSLGLTFLTVLLVSLSKSLVFIGIVATCLFLLISFMKVEDIGRILTAVIAVTAATFIILLPSLLWGGYYSVIMITAKVFVSLTAVNIFSRFVDWHSVIKGLKRLHIPNVFVWVLDVAIKYITLLGVYSVNMLYALKLRSVGKNEKKNASVSGLAGTMFLKSRQMAEEMSQAMECRGFSGEYYSGRFIARAADLIPIVFAIALLAGFLYFWRITN